MGNLPYSPSLWHVFGVGRNDYSLSLWDVFAVQSNDYSPSLWDVSTVESNDYSSSLWDVFAVESNDYSPSLWDETADEPDGLVVEPAPNTLVPAASEVSSVLSASGCRRSFSGLSESRFIRTVDRRGDGRLSLRTLCTVNINFTDFFPLYYSGQVSVNGECDGSSH